MKLVQGKIEQISVKEIANGPDRFDNTHRRSAKIEGVWYSFGGCKSNKWNVKVGNDFKVLGVGSEVAFKAEQSGDFWNGKSLMVLNLVEGSDAKPSQQSGGTQSQGETKQPYQPKPKDMSGVEAGQSLNGAMNFILTYGIDASNESIVAYGKKVHAATVKVKESYKKDNPDVPEYDAGARCGLAILTACKLVGTEVDFEQGIINLAQDILNNVLEPLTEFVKTPQVSASPAKVTRAPVKKPAQTKAKPVMEPLADSGGFEDMDDEIPFANPLSRTGLHLAI